MKQEKRHRCPFHPSSFLFVLRLVPVSRTPLAALPNGRQGEQRSLAGSPEAGRLLLSGFLVRRVLPLLTAELLQFQPLRPARFLLGAVVAIAAHCTLQPDVFTHDLGLPYAMTLVTTPEPTVRPPSRIANRRFASMAIGLSGNSSTVALMLSPGMHISTPSGSFTSPVTSVVRK